MNVRVDSIAGADLMAALPLGEAERSNFHYWLTCTQHLWAGFVDDQLACAWGLVPPTLLSDSALLWLHTTPLVNDHRFVFVRRSQLAVAEMLRLYPIITGVTLANAEGSRKWIEWLGGTYGKCEGKVMPFMIKAAVNG
jgi:hypothetical protein